MKDTQIIVRCSSQDKLWYEEAAKLRGIKLSAWVTATLDKELSSVLGDVFSVEMSEEEAADLGRRANADGMSISEYIKKCCQCAVQPHATPVVTPARYTNENGHSLGCKCARCSK